MPTRTPTPTPTLIETPTPRPSRSQPTIATGEGTIKKGRGVEVRIAGAHIGEGLVEEVMVGGTKINPSKIIFDGDGFSFITTTAALEAAGNRVSVVTTHGQDSVALGAIAGKAAPR